jgi:hypothetical protein
LEGNYTYVPTEAGFSVGAVMSGTFSAIRKKPKLLVGLAAFPSIFIIASIPLSFIPGSGEILSGCLGIAFSLSNVIIQAAISYAVFESFMGNDVTMKSSISRGLSRVGRLILLGLAMGISVAFSAILILIPSIILTAMWAVALPACTIEKLGVVDSLGRSRRLTKGYRWKVLGLLSLSFTMMFMAYLVITIVVGITMFFLPLGIVLTGILLLPALIVTNAFMSVMVGVMYCRLRSVKEGLVSADLTNVFN